MEADGWEYCQLVEADLVYDWYGNTYISNNGHYDLFTRGSDYVITPPHTSERKLENYSHVEGYLTTKYWTRSPVFSGDYTIQGNLGSSEKPNIVTKHYNGRTMPDSNNNNARYYFTFDQVAEKHLNDNNITESNNQNNVIDEETIEAEIEPEEPAKKYKQCTVCYGTTRCGGCGGTGTVYNSIDYSPGQYVSCSACGGSGACQMCEGSGLIEDFGW